MELFILIVIIVLIVVIVKAVKKAKAEEREEEQLAYAENSEYVQKAFKFIEFYEAIPEKRFLIVTPKMIGVRLPSEISGDYPGVAITTYQQTLQWNLKGGPQETKRVAEEFLEKNIAKFLGNAANMERFKSLSLRVKLHNNDDDCPFIYMVAPYAPSADRELYLKAIERKYKSKYGKELKIYHLDDY